MGLPRGRIGSWNLTSSPSEDAIVGHHLKNLTILGGLYKHAIFSLNVLLTRSEIGVFVGKWLTTWTSFRSSHLWTMIKMPKQLYQYFQMQIRREKMCFNTVFQETSYRELGSGLPRGTMGFAQSWCDQSLPTYPSASGGMEVPSCPSWR